MLDNDSLAVGLVASNGTGTNLAVWIHDDSGLTKHDVANHTDLNTQLGLAVLTNGSLVLSALTSDGTLSVYEHWPGASGWVQHTVPQPGTSNDGYRLDSIGGDHPTLAIRATPSPPYCRSTRPVSGVSLRSDLRRPPTGPGT